MSSNVNNINNNIINSITNSTNQNNNLNKIKDTDDTFLNMLKEDINKVNDQKLKADKLVRELAAGQNDNIAGTMIALEKADISMKLLIQVRNKVINAYQEIMRIQL